LSTAFLGSALSQRRQNNRLKVKFKATSPKVWLFIIKRERGGDKAQRGNERRAEGRYGEREEDWEEEGGKGGGREVREEA
jgi:hypothetical protein